MNKVVSTLLYLRQHKQLKLRWITVELHISEIGRLHNCVAKSHSHQKVRIWSSLYQHCPVYLYSANRFEICTALAIKTNIEIQNISMEIHYRKNLEHRPTSASWKFLLFPPEKKEAAAEKQSWRKKISIEHENICWTERSSSFSRAAFEASFTQKKWRFLR